jgi:hypothetical protein
VEWRQAEPDSHAGKYVRYGPNRVSINSPEAARDLHDVKSNTFKSDAYGAFKTFFGAEMSLTTVDHKVHGFRRRVNSAGLTPHAVRELEPHVTPHLDYFIKLLAEDAGTKTDGDKGWGNGKNMANMFAFVIADIMGQCTFSQSWNTQKDEEKRQFVEQLPQGVAGIHLVSLAPSG